MWDYIVLGEIPGTSIQVSFETWLISVIALVMGYAVVLMAWRLRQRHVLIMAAIVISLYARHGFRWRYLSSFFRLSRLRIRPATS